MRKSKKQGFSLVEVVLALGVVAFAFVAILGLIPAGMSSFRQAINISVGSQLGQKVISDAFQSDYDTLLTAPGTAAPGGTLDATQPFLALYRYFDEEGNEIISTPPPAANASGNAAPSNAMGKIPFIYLAITRIIPNITLPGSTTASSPTASVVVQVVFDPSQYLPSLTADFTPVTNAPTTIQSSLLLSPNSPNIPAGNVLTYYAYITRN
jgi:uncharacterized protein (TIGR02598 family)